MDDWYNEDGQHGTVVGVSSSTPTTGGTLNFGNHFYPGPQAEYGNRTPYTGQSGAGQRIGGDDEEDYSNETPLLEELGINFEHIWAKTRAVMILIRRSDSLHLEDADLAGPIVFCLIFGFLLLLKGKVCVCVCVWCYCDVYVDVRWVTLNAIPPLRFTSGIYMGLVFRDVVHSH